MIVHAEWCLHLITGAHGFVMMTRDEVIDTMWSVHGDIFKGS
jgi:hypothetical protein